jgi:putative OPT family oligopeptide transporter
MSKETGEIKGLPENARRVLHEGEKYIPVVPDETGVKEVTARSVSMGLIFCAIFSMAAAYLALKVGQGIEAAIPISILAVGLGVFFKRKSTLLENVIIQSIGANSSHVVAGAVFTIPALYMLAAIPGSGVTQPSMLQVIMVSFLGGCLGILFLIPLRYHFVSEMHGQFPWPEATATTQILLSGERAGKQAGILALSAGIGALYDGLVTTFHGMAETITLKSVGIGKFFQSNFMTFRMLNNAAIIGIGYIIGLKYAMVIAAGSFLSFFVLVPLVYKIGATLQTALPPGEILIAAMSPDQVFRNYVRIIGVGGIAGAGIMGVVTSFPSMVRSISANMKGLKSKGAHQETVSVPRTERSLTGVTVMCGLAAFVVVALLFFSFGLGLESPLLPAFIGVGLVLFIAFLFAPVAARAIAIIGTNPVSGMTMLTLIITGFVMLKLGLSGGQGMFVTMMVGGVVCTALAASGALSTDLKIGHWLGATPAKQLALKFLGTLVAATFCGIAMWVMSQSGPTQGFGSSAIPAPQASAMKEILVGIFGVEGGGLRWFLFALGVILSIILRMVNVPALAFALGMYLPIELNTPVLLGGILGYIVQKKGANDTEETANKRNDIGILVASGFMAGGAIMGVINAVANAVIVKSTGSLDAKESIYILSDKVWEGSGGEIIALLGVTALSVFIVMYSKYKAKDALI